MSHHQHEQQQRPLGSIAALHTADVVPKHVDEDEDDMKMCDVSQRSSIGEESYGGRSPSFDSPSKEQAKPVVPAFRVVDAPSARRDISDGGGLSPASPSLGLNDRYEAGFTFDEKKSGGTNNPLLFSTNIGSSLHLCASPDVSEIDAGDFSARRNSGGANTATPSLSVQTEDEHSEKREEEEQPAKVTPKEKVFSCC